MILVETAQDHINQDHINKEDSAEAIGELKEVSPSPDFAEAHYRLGLALSKSSTGSSKAEPAFQLVLQLNPTDPAAYFRLGLRLEARGDKMQRSSFFAKAAQLAPGLTEAHRELGQMAKQSQDRRDSHAITIFSS
jgi:tetratricopeptide (TPR) repeat protein